MGTIELDETVALRLLLDYPRDFIKASEAGTSSKDIARMEQSLRDRSTNLDARPTLSTRGRRLWTSGKKPLRRARRPEIRTFWTKPRKHPPRRPVALQELKINGNRNPLIIQNPVRPEFHVRLGRA